DRDLLSAGAPDPTFNGTGKATVGFNLGGDRSDIASGVAIDAAGRVVVAGFAERTGPTNTVFAVARLSADGSLDASFDGDGRAIIDFGPAAAGANAVAIDAAGRIVVAGYVQPLPGAGPAAFAVARLNADGSLDASFDGDGRALIDFGPFADIASAVAL